MPYETVAGSHELASRLGHSAAAVRAVADNRTFHVPAEALRDAEDIKKKVRPRGDFLFPDEKRLTAALAIDGSYVVERIRDGLPSVLYGFAQAAAAYVDLTIMESQAAERFVDPYEVERAVNTALVTLDLPVAGAYTREGVDIATSWREAIDGLFRAKKVQVNRLDESLLDLLFLLHGRPGAPASRLPVNCPTEDCQKDVMVPAAGVECIACNEWLYPTDVLRIHEEVGEEGSNQSALGRLMSVVELLVLVGLATLLWEQSRYELLPRTLFIVDGPLAVYGPPAKLRARALEYFQFMDAGTPGDAPYLCGLEKTGAMVDFARQLARHEILQPGEVLVCDEEILARVTNATNVQAYGKETYWGRKFVYRALDGRVVVPTVMPAVGAPYDANGGQPDPKDYPTLPAIIDVIDRTGSSMYVDGIIPVAAAHGKAAFPIGVGTDVLRLVATQRLGLAQGS
ncbi:DNA double-strand break repair nuclease NurA [Nocardioides nitrophenolicus]|uniref:DNA double-strand break repair nuclease NurA n=1 Tax=Nocardioides nitrophenolicus TaxID=60489 RepID=UPI001958D222|nr:DNA double-strand break repair nuclease NurA [Nocardioides nitrophenolicus]MBM7517555.1 hypothetical protein [Nocardioides nitrophenolicus]